MSFDDVYSEVLARIGLHEYDDEEPAPDLLDRLVLEVQAEMDCRFWAWRQTCEVRYFDTDIDTKWCKRCIAKYKLAQEKAAVV